MRPGLCGGRIKCGRIILGWSFRGEVGSQAVQGAADTEGAVI